MSITKRSCRNTADHRSDWHVPRSDGPSTRAFQVIAGADGREAAHASCSMRGVVADEAGDHERCFGVEQVEQRLTCPSGR